MKIQYVSVGILINNELEILVEKNTTNSIFKGLWQFPGGKVEASEPPLQALERELLEEINVTPLSTTPISFVEYRLENNNKYYTVFFYLVNSWQGEIQAKLNQELSWVSLDTLRLLPKLPYNKAVVETLYSHIKVK